MLLVTGGAGFIGSNVVAALNDAGRADVTVCDLLGDAGKWLNLAKRRLADIVRTRIAPLVLPLATRFEAVRDYMFRTVSQIMVNYHDSPLSRGAAGQIRAGDRLPWVIVGNADNHAPLKQIT